MRREHGNITEIDCYYGHEQIWESLLPANIHAGVDEDRKRLEFFSCKNMRKINSFPVVMKDNRKSYCLLEIFTDDGKKR